MKNSLLLAVFKLWFINHLNAQTNDNYFSIRAGFSYSTTLTKQLPGSLLISPKINGALGMYTGVFYKKKLSNILTTRTEINFQNKRLLMQKIYNGLPQEETYNFNYIGLSPTIGFNLLDNLDLLAGPEINYLLHEDSGERIRKPLEIGITVRGSYKYRHIFIDIGYFNGLNSFNKASESNTDFKFYNRNIQLGLGYIF